MELTRQSPLNVYMAEVRRHPTLSREQEVALARQYQATGEVTAAHALVIANLRFVAKIAHQYRGYGLRLLDLIQEGNLGLMTAVRKFDPDRGYRLISYAVWWIRAYIQSFILKSWSLVKVATTQTQRRLFFRLSGARSQAFMDEVPEDDMVETMARRLGVREDQVRDMESRMAAHDFSLDAPTYDGSRLTHLDLLRDEAGGPDERAVRSGEARRAWRRLSAVWPKLSQRERYIVGQRILSEVPKTLQEVGDHFGVSRERARQIETEALKKLRYTESGCGGSESR